MSIKITSERLTAEISLEGAELVSLKSNGNEWIWTAEDVWKRHAPLLFPFICNTKSKGYTVNGKPYKLSNHGFARDSVFSVESSSESSVTLSLCSNSSTLSIYPYEFVLTVTYSLNGSSLFTEIEITNRSDSDMPCFIGGHPGFLCPFASDTGSTFEDYDIVYEKPETIVQQLEDSVHTVIENGTTVPVTRELFRNDVFMKDKPASSAVSLVSRKSGKSVTVSYDNSGCIAVWSPYDDSGHFVCLEPWSSAPVYCSNTEELTQMTHAIVLSPGKKRRFGFEIAINE